MSQNYTDTNISNMILNDMTEAQFAQLTNVDSNQLYLTEDESANQDLSNVTNTGKVLMSGMGMPSNTYINLTLGESNSTYTAPANGYYLCYIGGSTGSKWLRLFTSGNYLQEAGFSTNNNIGFTIPIQKGQTLNVRYSGNLTVMGLMFIYAQGSESEAS